MNMAAMTVVPTYPTFDLVKPSALRALELDPLDGEACALLAVIAYRVEYDWRSAEPMFHEALRLAPNSSLTHASYAWALVFNGRFDEAMQHARLARELDPLNLDVRANNAAIATYARQYDVAIREFQAVLDLEPAHLFSNVMLGLTYLSIGENELAMPLFDRVCQLMPSHPSAYFCRIGVLGLRNEIERGREELAALLTRLGDSHCSRVNLAMAQSCLGEAAGAYQSLEYAATTHDVLFVSLPAHALFDRNRHDPRYLSLLHRHGPALLPPFPVRGAAKGDSPIKLG
ncbi:MAG: hypothetical protein ABI277_14910 [Burkholderiaceae bacterium]